MLNEIAQLYCTYARKQGPMDNPDAVGEEGARGEGPFMIISLRFAKDDAAQSSAQDMALNEVMIAHAQFETYACPTATACGSWTCEWAVGKTLADAAALTPRDIDTGLHGLPLGKAHCADLAANAMRRAAISCSHSVQNGG